MYKIENTHSHSHTNTQHKKNPLRKKIYSICSIKISLICVSKRKRRKKNKMKWNKKGTFIESYIKVERRVKEKKTLRWSAKEKEKASIGRNVEKSRVKLLANSIGWLHYMLCISVYIFKFQLKREPWLNNVRKHILRVQN